MVPVSKNLETQRRLNLFLQLVTKRHIYWWMASRQYTHCLQIKHQKAVLDFPFYPERTKIMEHVARLPK